MSSSDHYRVLQIQPDAVPEVVAAAYRALARLHHPDLGGDARTMAAVNDAWEVLGNPVRRAEYDAARVAPASRPPVATTPSPDAPLAARRHAQTTATVMDYGRYAGWRLDEIARHDRPFLEHLARVPSGVRYRAEIYRLLSAA